jgi:hypothetical protein
LTPDRLSLSRRDRAALALLRLVPDRLARHALFLLKSRPALADRWGYHIRPIHYYEPLPDFGRLSEASVRRRREPPAIDFDWAGQTQLMTRLGGAYRGEIESLAAAGHFDYTNPYFAGLDAAVYYALIRDRRPKRVIEIGSGFSTRMAVLALSRNQADGSPGTLTCIEPFPDARLTPVLPDVTLVQQPVEELPLTLFDDLATDDMLFIDSSHAVRFGGDVCREFLDILPRLAPGVWIHVHDIFFPYDYPPEWLLKRRLAFAEQYLLEAFLAFNRAFAVRAANCWLAAEFAEVARLLLPARLWPGDDLGRGSLWMQRVL